MHLQLSLIPSFVLTKHIHHHPANLRLQHLSYLAIKATPESMGDKIWLWLGGPWCCKAISILTLFFLFVCLMGLYQTGTTGYRSNHERSTNYSQPYILSRYPRLCFLFTCQSNININLILDFHQRSFLFLCMCFRSSLYSVWKESYYQFVNIAEKPLSIFHSPSLYYYDSASSVKASLYY